MESFIDDKIREVKQVGYQKTLIEKGWVSFDDAHPELDSMVHVYWKNGCKTILHWTNTKALKWQPKFWKINKKD